jgi:hypothetical protein
MFPFDYLLAVALLTAPPDSPEPTVPPDVHAQLQPTLQSLAVDWQILDPREIRYLLVRPEDITSDLNLLRRRYCDLADAPALEEGLRFPERAVVNELLAFNRAYRQHLDTCLTVELVHWWELHEALQETDRLYQVWDAVRDARCEYYYVTVRRLALKRLREMIGEDAYFTGTLPPYVPVWRFQRID